MCGDGAKVRTWVWGAGRGGSLDGVEFGGLVGVMGAFAGVGGCHTHAYLIEDVLDADCPHYYR